MEDAVTAVRNGDLSYFQGLSSDHLRFLITKKDEDGRTLFHSSSAVGNLNIMQILLDNGAASTITYTDDEGWVPLHSSASAGHLDAVKLLLSLGADSSATTPRGRTPLHYASSKGHLEVCELLMEAGSRANGIDAFGETPLHRAAATGRLNVIKLLLESQRGLHIDVKNKEGATPLLLACIGGHKGAALYLASKGANVETEDSCGETPLGAASKYPGLRETLVKIALGELDIDEYVL